MPFRIYPRGRDLESSLKHAQKNLAKPDTSDWKPPAQEREVLYVCEACGAGHWRLPSEQKDQAPRCEGCRE